MQNKEFQTKPYYIGIDIGTDSVGYAVTDKDYLLHRFKGKPMWGVTLFDEAKLCTDRRNARATRRRYERRKQRIQLMRELFCNEIYKIDPHFFERINQSYRLQEERDSDVFDQNVVFDKECGKKYPTIHHLIKKLMDSAAGADIRHIYIACAWLAAHRGHFLLETESENIEELTDIEPLYDEFEQWFRDNELDLPWDRKTDEMKEIMSSRSDGITKKKEKLQVLFGINKKTSDPEGYPISRSAMVNLLAGGKEELGKLLTDEKYKDDDKKTKISFTDPERLEEELAKLGDDGDIIRIAAKLYDCAALSEKLGGEKYISQVKVGDYETHKNDLSELKNLLKNRRSKYNEMFRSGIKDSYSAYVANYKSIKADNVKKTTRDGFYDYVRKTLKGLENITDEEQEVVAGIQIRIDEGTYMPKQVNSDNRLIPHQLYYAELKKILDNAEKEFPFLKQKDDIGLSVSDKIKSVFTFRIPYYIGPLNKNSSHSWIERKADGKIYPWNFEDVVDIDKSEEAFIKRMTNKCTYLPGEDVLPKWSLLYCKFNVLNEINNIKVNGKPISVEDKQKLYNEVFKKHTKVTRKKIIDFMVSNKIIEKGGEDSVSGIDKDIKSTLKPYIDFDEQLSAGRLSECDVERIIERMSCAQEGKRLKDWLKNEFENLSEADIKKIVSRKYPDFGRLSKELLNGIEGCNKTGELGTVMYFMWNTNDNFMQIVADESKYNFAGLIKKIKEDYYKENPRTINDKLDDMGISNAVKRPVMRALDVLSDIVKANKGAPEKIFVEMARGGTKEQKGKRTESRADQLRSLIENTVKNAELAVDSREIIKNIEKWGNGKLQSEKYYLYCCQLGKCMYCGKNIDINDLADNSKYNIDHIWPQAYIKDDSIHNNKVLVCSKENGDKTDRYPVPQEYRNNMYGWWKKLFDNKLINEEKFRRLTRSTPFTDSEKQGFINRQLVETSQAAKAVAALLKELYPDSEIVYVKSGIASTFRHEYGEIKSKALDLRFSDEQKKEAELVKSRTANDIHHAHDAYLNIVAGNLYHEKFTKKRYNANAYSLNYKTLFGREFEGVWNPQKHLLNVDRTMATKDIHLTKYLTKQKGQFFDINPVKAAENLVPVKKDRPTEKYGGYNKPTVSFFVLAGCKSGKKYELTLVPVTLLAADKFENDNEFAEEYIKGRLGDGVKDISFPLGLRPIKINTVFSLDGFDVCLAGKTGTNQVVLRSLVTPYYPDRYVKYIKKIENTAEKRKNNKDYEPDEAHDGISRVMNTELFDYITDKIHKKPYTLMPGAEIKVERSKFEKLGTVGQLSVLENMILYLKTNRHGGCDTKLAGGKKAGGAVILSANISDWKKYYTDVRIKDRSASGLYESVSVNLLGLLENEAMPYQTSFDDLKKS